MHWYVALVTVLVLGGTFFGYVGRTSRREWVKSGRSAAEYNERLRRNRRQVLPLVLLLALFFLLIRLGVFPDQVSPWLQLVPVLVFVPWALHDLWRDRGRITQQKNWWIQALGHAVLLLVLFGLTWLVMPFLLGLP